MEFFSRRPSMSPLLLLFIFVTLVPSILSKHHIRHHRDRFKRQQGAHLYLPGTSVTSGGEGPDAGPWGEWSQPSPCSRTCGGGVSTQYRECQPGYTCQGPTRRHFSCNTQDCPDIADFRAQQCSEFDRIPFEGVYYQWIPYTKAPNACELNCMPRGERFYYRHKQQVIDGTRCNDEKLDVCVEGTCQPVGCDMMLGSDAREDRCRQCGGDGSMCNTVTGLLDMQDLQVGYNDILLVPSGATNVVVQEISPSNNYLAVRNTTGYYYLNGNWRIDFPRSLDFAGCRFHYNRFPKGFSAPDSVTCLGPTDEALFIVLLYQDTNVGVEYEYSIPKNVQPGGITETYAWTFDQFTPCSVTCGGGVQYRNVSCAGRRTLEPADRTLCDTANEPASVQRCGEQPCEPRWVTKPWEKCSTPCGNNGIQTRQVYCEQIIANGVGSIVDDEYCINIQKPSNEQPCNQGVVCAEWYTEPWKPCDRLCGEGKETRKVICYRKVNGKIHVVDEAECLPQTPKPETEKKCNLRPCEGVDWVTSEWSGCEDKCGLASETRRVQCATQKGEILAQELCEDIPIPTLVRQCTTIDAACDFQWYSSQWSECSAKCGSGVQTRKVFCGSLNEEGIKKVEEGKCDPKKKYDNMKNCTAELKECTGEWFTGPFTKCSKPCGGGERMRKVICLQDNVAVSPSACDPNTISFSSESCNTHSCSEDQILSSSVIPDVSATTLMDTDVSLTTISDAQSGISEDEEYEIVYDDECKGGEWIDDEDAATPNTPKSSTSPSKSKQNSEIFNDELMMGDDPAASEEDSSVLGSGDGYSSTESSSTFEGSGDYSTTDVTESGVTEDNETIDTQSSKKTTPKKKSSLPFVGELDYGAEDESAELTTQSLTSSDSDTDSTLDVSSLSSSSTDQSESTESGATTEEPENTVTGGTTEEPESTESRATSEKPESTENGATTEEPESTESGATTEEPESTESGATTEEPESTESGATTEEPESTESGATTEEPESTESGAATEEPESTESGATTEKSKSTESGPTSDKSESSLAGSSTEEPESTESGATTEESESTESGATTEEPESTESGATTEMPESTESGATTEESESTESGPTSDKSESSLAGSSTEEPKSTESGATTEESEGTESGATTEEPESTESGATTEKPESTESGATTEESESTESGATTEEPESTESGATTEKPESTESGATTKESESTESGATTEEPESTESEGTTEESESTESGPTSDKSESSLAGSSTEETKSTESGATIEKSESTESSPITEKAESSLSSSSTEELKSTESSATTEQSESTETSTEKSESSISGASTEESLSTESGASTAESTISGSSIMTSDSSTDKTDITVSSLSTEFLESSSSISSESSLSVTSETSTERKASTGESESTVSGISTEQLSTSTELSSEVTASSASESTIEASSLSSASSESLSSVSGMSTEESSSATTVASSEESSPVSEASSAESESNVSSKGTESSISTEISSSTLISSSTESATEFTGSTESTTEFTGTTESTTEFTGSTESTTEFTGSTESTTEFTGSTKSTTEFTGSTESTTEFTGSTESTTEFTGSTESTTEFTGSTESTTKFTGSTEFDIWASYSTESDVSSLSTSSDLWETTSKMEIFMTKKLRKCRRRKKKDCKKSKFGCCVDQITPAQGPFDKGCPSITTCKEAPFGCCEDGISVAKGKDFEGCPASKCNETLFGCCPDSKTAAEGNDNEGCPPACFSSKYGCCKDNLTEAIGPNKEGCAEQTESTTVESTTVTEVSTTVTEMSTTITEMSTTDIEKCTETTYGCCPDGVSIATGEDLKGCDVIKDNCSESYFGCCPDGVSSAQGPGYKGCKMPCEENQFGCCEDGVTPAHGPNREGCCLHSQYGCCPDNIRPAQGPSLEGCGCEYSPYRCCPDNVTAAKGYHYKGCGCQYAQFECCPDGHTEAFGPEYQGCPCHTFQFGCCPDGVTAALGPLQQGCGCRNTKYGCCPDEQTYAQGPNSEGCGCESSKYGCCLDGRSEAQGDNFEGCTEAPINLQGSCIFEKDRGPCTNYTVKWFFDMEYGGCSRFWYGGCDGNDNRFKSKEECHAVCVEPQGRDRCSLPKVTGACEGYYPLWYYDTERRTCAQFVYSGCLGNNNKFETREECMELCVKDDSVDACEQPKEEGLCHGNYIRWYYDKNDDICSQFIYGGCKANHNNFLTESACKQRCIKPGQKKDHCSLPKAEGNCTANDPRWYYNTSESRCMPFYYTGCEGNNNNFPSEDACKADCPIEIVKDTCQLSPEIGECANYVDRWYFDTKDKRCRQFYYGGCGGNGNNFETEQTCLQRCGLLQPEPQPEPKPQPEPQPETRVTQSPPPITPVTVMLEPFRKESCFLDSDIGPCHLYDPRWYYDRTDGSCKQFMYGGCPGNGNNFKTPEECQNKCGDVQDLCGLPPAVGLCAGEYEQWYYNSSTGMCQTFIYGGCLGNNNRFEDQRSCENRCKSQRPTPPITVAPPTILQPQPGPSRPSEVPICHVAPDPGNCTDSIPSYYYDPATQKCTAFIYTGCGGNANRYYTIEQCERQCGKFRGQDVCRMSRDPGPCSENIVKYFYDAPAGRCAPFYFGGCEGNGNRFSSYEECEYICVTHEEKKPPVITNETASTICRLPLDVGPCEGGYYKHYFFDDSRGECTPFIYSGCGGNFNNFKSFQACIEFCKEFMIPTEPPQIGPHRPGIGEHPCQEYIDECGTMRCEYGTEAYVDEETQCTRCRCHNPCHDSLCDEGFQCAVDLNRNRTASDDPTFIAVCRSVNKEGECPQITENENRCERECENDAHCSMDLKCCSTGCGTSCVVPISPIPAKLITTSYLPAYTEKPIQAGYYPPKVDEQKFSPEVSAGEGDYATLDCAVQGNPTPTITWKKGNLVIDGSQPRYRLLLDGALQIITLHKTDSGIYLCAAYNGIGEPIAKEIKLDVTDSVPHPSSIIGDETNTHVVAALGAPTTLQCYATGFPFPAITWWKDSSMIPLRTSQFEVRKDYSLLIHSVQLSNLGIYTCQAYNGIGKAASWSVTVQALGPVFSTRPEDSKYMQYVINPPERPSTIPPYRPEYPHRPEPQPQVPPVINTELEYDPNEIVPEPPAQGNKVFQVPVRATITQTQSRFKTGNDISIGCDVDGYPIPQVQWYKDGKPLYASSLVEISESHRLHIKDAKQSDAGEYRCEAGNDYSRSASSIVIEVEGVHILPNCTDNQFFANCALIVRAQYCVHRYYARFCCKSCTEAGQLPVDGMHLGFLNDEHSAIDNNLV